MSDGVAGHRPSLDAYLRGSLHAKFASWEAQDVYVSHVLRKRRHKPADGDVLAVPATLHGVRQNGYYIGCLRRRAGKPWIDFYEPTLTAHDFVLPKDTDDSIPFCTDIAYIPVAKVLIRRAGNAITLTRTVDEHVCTFLRLRSGAKVEAEEVDADKLSELDDDADSDSHKLERKRRRCDGSKGATRKKIILDSDGSDDVDDEDEDDNNGVVARPGAGTEHANANADTTPLLPAYFPDLKAFRTFASTWRAIDDRMKVVNAKYANMSAAGCIGYDVLAVPVQGPAPAASRGYLTVKFVAYNGLTKMLTGLVLIPLSADRMRYVEGYQHVFHDVAIDDAFVPLRAASGTEVTASGAVLHVTRLAVPLDAAIAAHLNVELDMIVCAYPSERKKVDDNKARQNKAIYQAVRDTRGGVNTAIVLDSVGYRTSSKLVSKCCVKRVVVPNNSTDCGQMQHPPAGVVLLPGVTLLQEIQRWDVAAEGPIGCVVADTCRHFNDDLQLALSVAFPKLADAAIVSVTVSTRSLPQKEALKAITTFMKVTAARTGFVNSTGAGKVRPVGLPILYGSNMLFVLYSLSRGGV